MSAATSTADAGTKRPDARPSSSRQSRPSQPSQPSSKKHVIRTLGKSLREYKKESLLSPLFVIVEAIIEILIPSVIAVLIDKGITGKSMPDIWKYGLILIGCAAVSLCAGFLSGRFAAIASSGFATNLRQAEFRKVQDLSVANIER